MKTTTERASATIYTFPKGGRAGLVGRFEEVRSVAEAAVQPVYADLAGSGWYHEAAIVDVDGPRKH